MSVCHQLSCTKPTKLYRQLNCEKFQRAPNMFFYDLFFFKFCYWNFWLTLLIMLYSEMMSRTRRSISMHQNISLVVWVQIRSAEIQLRTDSVPVSRTSASIIIYRYVHRHRRNLFWYDQIFFKKIIHNIYSFCSMELCTFWFFFCIFVNMMIFHIKIKYVKIDPQSYIPINLF